MNETTIDYLSYDQAWAHLVVAMGMMDSLRLGPDRVVSQDIVRLVNNLKSQYHREVKVAPAGKLVA